MKARRAFSPTAFDQLESREVLSHLGIGPAGPHAMSFSHASAAIAAPAPAVVVNLNVAMAKAGHDLIAVYQAFTSNGGNVAALAAQFPQLQFKGDKISIMVKASSVANYNALVPALKNLGMDISIASSPYALVSGYLPVSQLLTVAQLPLTANMTPNYRPVLSTPHFGFGGAMMHY